MAGAECALQLLLCIQQTQLERDVRFSADEAGRLHGLVSRWGYIRVFPFDVKFETSFGSNRAARIAQSPLELCFGALLAPPRQMRLRQRLLWLVAFCAADNTVDVAVDAGGGQTQVDSDNFAAAKSDLAELVASLTGSARTKAPDLASAVKCASCVELTIKRRCAVLKLTLALCAGWSRRLSPRATAPSIWPRWLR